jgi:hypothetical protein
MARSYKKLRNGGQSSSKRKTRKARKVSSYKTSQKKVSKRKHIGGGKKKSKKINKRKRHNKRRNIKDGGGDGYGLQQQQQQQRQQPRPRPSGAQMPRSPLLEASREARAPIKEQKRKNYIEETYNKVIEYNNKLIEKLKIYKNNSETRINNLIKNEQARFNKDLKKEGENRKKFINAFKIGNIVNRFAKFAKTSYPKDDELEKLNQLEATEVVQELQVSVAMPEYIVTINTDSLKFPKEDGPYTRQQTDFNN